MEKEVSELESLSKFPTSIRQQLLGELEEGPFWEVPVGPGTFLRDPEYTDPEDRPWPGVEEEIIKLFREKEKRNFVEALWIMGIGFGKNFGASHILKYLVYRLLCLRNPQKYYGLASNSIIALLNMAPSGHQAREVFFTELRNRFFLSEWFRKYRFLPDPSVESVLKFPKGILIRPGSSSRTLTLGYNIFAGILDEGAWMIEVSSEIIWNSMLRRIKTRFGRDGLLLALSAPNYEDDFIERKATEEGVYVSRNPTWANRRPNFYSGKMFSFDTEKMEIIR